MTQDYGMPAHGKHVHANLRAISRYLVVIRSEDEALARLFDARRAQVGEFDAGTEEVAVMTRGLVPRRSAAEPEWDQALQAHSAAERAEAEVYLLDV